MRSAHHYEVAIDGDSPAVVLAMARQLATQWSQQPPRFSLSWAVGRLDAALLEPLAPMLKSAEFAASFETQDPKALLRLLAAAGLNGSVCQPNGDHPDESMPYHTWSVQPDGSVHGLSELLAFPWSPTVPLLVTTGGPAAGRLWQLLPVADQASVEIHFQDTAHCAEQALDMLCARAPADHVLANWYCTRPSRNPARDTLLGVVALQRNSIEYERHAPGEHHLFVRVNRDIVPLQDADAFAGQLAGQVMRRLVPRHR